MEPAGSLSVRGRVDRLVLGCAALALAFVALAALVAGGQLGALDRYAVLHWMRGLDPSEATDTVPPVTGLFLPFRLGTPAWEQALDVVTYPASVLVSLVILGLGCWALLRRGARAAALVWAAAWIVANAIEVLLKVGLTKPALYASEDGAVHHLRAFDHSFPSGHALRAVLAAGLIAFVWRRLALPAAIWALLVP